MTRHASTAGRAATWVAVALSAAAVGLAAVAVEAPQVFDPLRKALGTFRPPHPAPPDAGLPAVRPPAEAGQAGAAAPVDAGAPLPAAAVLPAAGAPDAGSKAEPARPAKKKRRR